MHIPPTLVHPGSDHQQEPQRHGQRDDEQQHGRDVFRFKGTLDGDVGEGEFTFMSSDLVEQFEEEPTSTPRISTENPPSSGKGKRTYQSPTTNAQSPA